MFLELCKAGLANLIEVSQDILQSGIIDSAVDFLIIIKSVMYDLGLKYA